MFKLEIAIPTVDRHGNALDVQTVEIVKENAMFLLSEIGGGCTAVKGEGAWVNDKGKLIREAVTLIYTLVERIITQDELDEVKEFASSIAWGFDQEAVMVTYTSVGGNVFFVEGIGD